MLRRRIRGLVRTAFVWALVWMPVGIAMGIYRVLTDPPQHGYPADSSLIGFVLRIVAAVTTAWMVWGAISGGAFALLLWLAERRRELNTLSARRVGVWGALGAMALPLVVFALVLLEEPGFDLLGPAALALSLSALLGAACALGTLRVARRTAASVATPGAPAAA